MPHHFSEHGNVATITVNVQNSRTYFKDSMPRTLNFLHTFENSCLVDPDKHLSSVVNTTAFFFREGVWRHGIFVSRQNVKVKSSQVTFIYIVLLTIQIVSKHLTVSSWRIECQ